MTTTPLQSEIAGPTPDLEAIAGRIIARPGLLPEVFAGLHADKARIKFGCLKVLRLVSEQQPAVLYRDFGQFAGLLGSSNHILEWGAIIIVGNLAAVDSGNRIDALLDRYLQPLPGPALITAANTIGGAAKVALAKPHLADRIVAALLQVEKAKYPTPECRNVALGHALKALDLLVDRLRDRQPVIDFAKRQLRNRRNSVRRRARAFLQEHGGPG